MDSSWTNGFLTSLKVPSTNHCLALARTSNCCSVWQTPYASCPSPKHLPWRILLQWSSLQTTKLHYYYYSILKRFNNWNTNIAIWGGGFKFKSLGSSGRNFWRCLLATLLRSPGSVLLAPGSLRSQFSTMISSTMVLAALKIYVFACFFTSRVITVAMRDPSLAGWLLNWCPGKELFPFWMMVAHICPAWVLQSTTNKLIHHAAAWQWTKTHHWLTASSSPSGLFPPQRCM